MRAALVLWLAVAVAASQLGEQGRSTRDDVMEQNKDSILTINMKSGYASGLLDGDILSDEHETANARSGRYERSSYTSGAWPNPREGKPIEYYFENTFPTEGRKLFRKVVQSLESKTCIRFREVANARVNAIRVYNNNTASGDHDCHASLGKVENNHIYLGKACFTYGTVFHEIMHVLGFEHTQARTDRNKFVRVFYRNVKPTFADFFKPVNTSNKFTYDYGSVMHYSSTAFAIDKKKMTIAPIDNLYKFTIGQVEEPSFYDIMSINQVYQCLDRCVSGHAKCRNGGVPKANDCGACECPTGFGGATCQGKDKQGPTLYATPNNQTVTLDARKTYWIKAPCGQRVRLEFVSATQYESHDGCYYGHWNVKSKADPRNSGYRVCKAVQMGVADVSDTHLSILTTTGTHGAQYTIKYSSVKR